MENATIEIGNNVLTLTKVRPLGGVGGDDRFEIWESPEGHRISACRFDYRWEGDCFLNGKKVASFERMSSRKTLLAALVA